jgi:hypothetical protein
MIHTLTVAGTTWKKQWDSSTIKYQLLVYSIFTVHFSSIDSVFHQLNALVIKTQTVLEYFSVFITSAFSW